MTTQIQHEVFSSPFSVFPAKKVNFGILTKIMKSNIIIYIKKFPGLTGNKKKKNDEKKALTLTPSRINYPF